MSDATDSIDGRLAETDAPLDRPREVIDARELPPPQPLKRTLELLTELSDETVLVQLNDRAPQHLYPKLEDRGYRYDTCGARSAPEDGSGNAATGENPVVTAVWKP